MRIAALEVAVEGLAGWPGVFGRLHPVLVHLPIGLLVVLGVLELAALRGGEPSRRAQSLLATLAAFAAVVTAAAGWVLHLEEGNSETIERHEQLGIALATLTVLAAVAHAWSRGGTRRQGLALYRVALALALVLLVPTGHLGATLTHGEDYLTAPLGREHGAPASAEHRASVRAEARDDRPAGEAGEVAPAPAVAPAGESSAEASSFDRLVLPVLLERCSGCHGDTRRKAGSR